MPRNRAQLKEAAAAVDLFIRKNFPGLGYAAVLLDAKHREGVDVPTNMVLIGFTEAEGARIFRDHADVLDRVAREEKHNQESQIIVPSFTDLNKLKG